MNTDTQNLDGRIQGEILDGKFKNGIIDMPISQLSQYARVEVNKAVRNGLAQDRITIWEAVQVFQKWGILEDDWRQILHSQGINPWADFRS